MTADTLEPVALSELYQEVILDHGKKPRNKRAMAEATHSAEGYNPLCGDQIKVYLHVDGDRVADASFEGHGCAISQASASMMTQALKGQSLQQAHHLFETFRKAVTVPDLDGGCDHSHDPKLVEGEYDEELGMLNCLTGVRNYPNRIKCATLAWHAMESAIHGGEKVSTE